jgi:phosphate/sulfate permease
MELYLIIVVVLFALAISDLIVGVSNDAVNFLNSALGSKVAPRWVIMIIASIGMLFGVTFSSGMMEVARKGIFHPEKFVMPELLVIFLAVMLTDVILLDLYNTFGLPTSTTVSVVFELLGSAVAVSFIKIHQSGVDLIEIVDYINTAKALAIISGILLSIIIAFLAGAIIQFITRLVFTFDFAKRLKRYGSLWGGTALSAILYFILIKGAKGASFITPETVDWIQNHALLILGASLVFWTVIFQLLLWFTRVDMLKIIVLIGTGALAMAFAANDLVNFIGVPLAGFSSFKFANLTSDPLTATMEALAQPVKSNTLYLLIAGAIMVVTLWFSRKAQTVTKTEISLGRQDEGAERFDSTAFSRALVRMSIGLVDGFEKITPPSLRNWVNSRFSFETEDDVDSDPTDVASFDLVRASVNLVVASMLVSIGTMLKLPLSTTYVTFMVAMGTSLSDRAWGRESAVYRITGVLTVIGGWFFTALMAFTVSALFATLIYHFRIVAVVVLVAVAVYFVYRTHLYHHSKEKEEKGFHSDVALAKTADEAFYGIMNGMGSFFDSSSKTISRIFEYMSKEDRKGLKETLKSVNQLKRQNQELVGHLFRTVMLPGKDGHEVEPQLAQSIGALEEISRHMSELADMCYKHVDNNHKGLVDEQIDDFKEIDKTLSDFFNHVIRTLETPKNFRDDNVQQKGEALLKLMQSLDKKQIKRIKKKVTKKRQSRVYLAMLTTTEGVVENTMKLMDSCRQTSIFLEKA